MKEVHAKKRVGLGVISGAVVAIVVGILACCSGTAPITDNTQSGTTVTLSAGDATIEAHCP